MMQMEMNIRNATSEDLPILNRISVRSKKHWGYPEEWIQQWMDGLILTENDLFKSKVYVLEVANGLVGFCAVMENNDCYEIDHLWVLPQYIGKGYGKLLLSEAISRSVVEEKKIIVEADPNAESFYRSQGFVTFDHLESFPKGRFLPVMERKAINPTCKI